MENIQIKNIAPNEFSSISTNSSHFSIADVFLSADLFSQSIILLLILTSIFSWAMVLEKLSLLRYIKNEYKDVCTFYQNKNFLLKKDDKTELIKGLKYFRHVFKQVFISDFSDSSAKDMALHKISLRIEDVFRKLETRLYLLATITSSAPFVGLLGTVWGIINTFDKIAALKNSSIGAIAPSLAEALFATALGLFVAIPSLIFYNFLSHSIKNLKKEIFYFLDLITNSKS